MAAILARMKRYHKLVRDRVPEIIERSGKIAECHRLDDEGFRRALRLKVVEEAQELLAASDETLRTELADLAEVFAALLDAYAVSDEELIALRRARNEERGTFTQRIFLESVRD
jgi:predicted house-cleaning noncanonical NTP pyrophosphatase (MazG superfamily)